MSDKILTKEQFTYQYQLTHFIFIDSSVSTCHSRRRDMIRKFAIVFLWFWLTPIALIVTALLLYQYAHTTNIAEVGSIQTANPKGNHITGQVLGIQIDDMRPYYIANLLRNTRLEPYAHLMVETSDQYGLDYRLIPAIAMKESGGGNKVAEYTHNAWGWENGRTVFPSWEVAIATVAKTLKTKYVDKGLTTPEEIMPVYAPPQVLTGGKWARDIRYFFSKLENL